MTGERKGPLVLVKGAGDFATGIIHRLHSAGFRIVATELDKPLAVRRWVALSEAVYEGEYTVEGLTAVSTEGLYIDEKHREGKVPIIIDPEASILDKREFDIVVDARSAKRNLGTNMDEAPIVIAIGPGFTAGKDCHVVVETLAGRELGRVILEGSAEPDTGVPTPLDEGVACCCCAMGDMEALVVRSPTEGTFRLEKDIGSKVEEGDVLGKVIAHDGSAHDVKAGTSGLIRGLIRDGTPVGHKMKLGDIDPTEVMDHLCKISEKARAIGGGVLEASMMLLEKSGRLWQ